MRVVSGIFLLLGSASAFAGDFETVFSASEHQEVRRLHLNEVPLYEVNSHQWAFYAWAHAFSEKFQDWIPQMGQMTLVHVDSHTDMGPGTAIPISEKEAVANPWKFVESVANNLEPFGYIEIDKFIAPAVPFFFKKIIWIKPDFAEGKDVPVGDYEIEWVEASVNGEQGNFFFFGELGPGDCYDSETDELFRCSLEEKAKLGGFSISRKRKIGFQVLFSGDKLKMDDPYVLDIDMDTFSCLNTLDRPELPKHITNDAREIEDRVDELMETLSGLSRSPHVVTVATSKGSPMALARPIPFSRLSSRRGRQFPLRQVLHETESVDPSRRGSVAMDSESLEPDLVLPEEGLEDEIEQDLDPQDKFFYEDAFTPSEYIPIIRESLLLRLRQWISEAGQGQQTRFQN